MQRRQWLGRSLSIAVFWTLFLPRAFAQGPASAPSARQAAPIDLTGYWVAIITPDWRQRMIPPAKGDYLAVPITLAAQQVADAWDPAKDEAAGQQCKSYGAPAIMAAPTRLHITWQGENTLKVETDYGLQTRLLQFGAPTVSTAAPTWQGDSTARWEFAGRAGAGGRPRAPGTGDVAAPASARGNQSSTAQSFGSLSITTTRVRPGYLRKNGIPYSADVRMSEYWDVFTGPDGVRRLMVTQTVEDPKYLIRRWITTYNFKKESDGSKWDPTPCSARW